MSSFDPIRRVEHTATPFAPFPATVTDTAPGAVNVFPAFDAAAPSAAPVVGATGADAPDAETQATQAAYGAGFAAGRAAALREGVVGATTLADAVEELARFRAGLLERYQRELLELALGVARKVVQRELAENPEHWLGMLREAVHMALDRESIRIRVGAILHRFLLEHLPELRARLDDVKQLELVEDTALGETGCVVESRYGDLDLGIDSQIGAIRATLMGAE